MSKKQRKKKVGRFIAVFLITVMLASLTGFPVFARGGAIESDARAIQFGATENPNSPPPPDSNTGLPGSGTGGLGSENPGIAGEGTEEELVYDEQPDSMQAVENAIRLYEQPIVDAYNSGDWTGLEQVKNKKPRWQNAISNEHMPEGYVCITIPDGFDPEFMQEYFTFLVKYDVQPADTAELESLTQKYQDALQLAVQAAEESGNPEPDFSKAEALKPHWENPVADAMMPEGFVCEKILAGQNPEFVAEYYTFCLAASPAFAPANSFTDTWDGSIATAFSAGAGTQADPYIIQSAAELAYLAQGINNGSHNSSGKFYRLTVDIDLNNLEWDPIGGSGQKLIINHTVANSPRSHTAYRPFGGTFEGENHTISNLKISVWNSVAANYWKNDYRGLFGAAEDAALHNLNLQGVQILGGAATGALLGYAYGDVKIENVLASSVSISSRNNITAATAATANFGVGGLLGVYDEETAATGQNGHKLLVQGCRVEDLNLNSGDTNANLSTPFGVNIIGTGGMVGIVRAYSASGKVSTSSVIQLENVSVSGTVTSAAPQGTQTVPSKGVGGVVGAMLNVNASENRLNISQIEADVTVTTTGPVIQAVGGVVGFLGVWGSDNTQLAVTKPTVTTTISASSATRTQTGRAGGVLGEAITVNISGASGASSSGTVIRLDGQGKGEIKADISTDTSLYPGDPDGTGGVLGTFYANTSAACELYINDLHTSGNIYSYTHSVGGIAGHIQFQNTIGGTSKITNCTSSSAISSDNYYAGGLTGYVYIWADAVEFEIDSCSATGDVEVSGYYAGGACGYLEVTRPRDGHGQSYIYVKNSYATGNATTGTTFCGGFVGHAHGGAGTSGHVIVFENCWASGDVRTGSRSGAAEAAGGFVGDAMKSITFKNCYATGDVHGNYYHNGGFAGTSRSEDVGTDNYFYNCYATGNVVGRSFNNGGFVGRLWRGHLFNCYSVGSVNSSSTANGGFVGLTNYSSTLTNCFATGTVGPSNGTGFVGSSTLTTYTNCFFDTTTTTKSSGGAAGITGVSTSDMLNPDTFNQKGWDVLNVWHVSMAKRQRNEQTPWYIDKDATYPYLYYQADGFDTNGDGIGDGYLDPQKQFPTNFDNTNYFLGVVFAKEGANRKVVAPFRYDYVYNPNDSGTKAFTFDAMTVGAERAYFPYAYGSEVADYNSQQFWFRDGIKNNDNDGDAWVTTPRGKTVNLRANQPISFGAYSKTNIVAFSSGPFTDKSNNSRTWEYNTSSSYTWVGDKITYRVRFTNYHVSADWENIELVDPLAKGVTLANDFVFLYTGRLPGVDEQPGSNNQLSAEIKLQNLTDEPDPQAASGGEPYYLYKKGTGQYAGRYILSLHNLPVVEYAKIDPAQAGLILDGYYIEFVAQVEEPALTPTGQLPTSQAHFDTSYPYDNIRNRGTVTGKLQLWDPGELFDANGSSVNGNKVPLVVDGVTAEKVPIELEVDDEDRDPVYKDKIIRYVNNHRNYDESLFDFSIDKDYLFSDNSRTHTVLPNEDPNDPNVSPHERKDYTGFNPPSEYFRFDGWFYFKNEDEAQAYRNRTTNVTDPPNPDKIVKISMEDIALPTVLDPSANSQLAGRDVTLFARWRLKGPSFEFDKVDVDGNKLGELSTPPGVQNIHFKLYFWTGTSAPPAAEAYVTAANITTSENAPNKWIERDSHFFLSHDGTGSYTLCFPKTGYYNLVESQVRNGYYLPEVQWRYHATVADPPIAPSDVLDGPVAIKKQATVPAVIEFESKEVSGKTFWSLPNYTMEDLDFLKVSSAGTGTEKPTVPALVPGAQFQIYRWVGTGLPGADELVDISAPGSNWAMVDSDTSSDAAGQKGEVSLALIGIPNSIYQLVESKAAPHYQTPAGQWRLPFGSDGKLDTAAITAIKAGNGQLPPAFMIMPDTDPDWPGQIILFNIPEYYLPQMGGFGKIPLIVFGLSIVAAALGILFFIRPSVRNRKRYVRKSK